MDVIQVQQEITKYIKVIEKYLNELGPLGEAVAAAERDYEKALAVAELELMKDHPVTVVRDLAKGDCADEKYKLSAAEKCYKSCLVKVDAAQSSMNAYQSIFRHLETISS